MFLCMSNHETHFILVYRMCDKNRVAEQALEIVRLHWMIDDAVAQMKDGHRVLDVMFRERCRVQTYNDFTELWFNHVYEINDVLLTDHLSRLGAQIVRSRTVYGVCEQCNTHVRRYEVEEGHLVAKCGAYACGDMTVLSIFM